MNGLKCSMMLIGLFALVALAACAPAIPAANVVTTSTAEAAEQVYPYYLPLVTKPGVASQTIGEITAEIDWVYVDESRVALQYTISGLDWPDGPMPPSDMVFVNLSSASLAESAIGWGGSGGYTEPVQDGTITGATDQLFVDGALDVEEHPSIDLQVEISLQSTAFHFELHAPVRKGIRMENLEQTVVANDVAMTLKSLVLNPSRATAVICFQMPSPVDWGLTASTLTLGDREYSFSGGGLLPGTKGEVDVTDAERCNSIDFDLLDDPSSTSLTLTVPKLIASTPEVIDEARVQMANERLSGVGIEFEYENVDHGGNIVILKRPAGMEDPEIYPLIWEALAEQYEGPWSFVVPITR